MRFGGSKYEDDACARGVALGVSFAGKTGWDQSSVINQHLQDYNEPDHGLMDFQVVSDQLYIPSLTLCDFVP